MAAYMKTSQPFYGVARPKLNAALCKEMRLRFVPADRAAYERACSRCGSAPSGGAICRDRVRPTASAFYRPAIDEALRTADPPGCLVGFGRRRCGIPGRFRDSLAYRAQVRPILEHWIDDPDLWIRRTAIIAQVQHKGATDGAQLFLTTACAAVAKANFSFAKPFTGAPRLQQEQPLKRCVIFYWKIGKLWRRSACAREQSIWYV